jgi:H+/Cl- antiporter ClcA
MSHEPDRGRLRALTTYLLSSVVLHLIWEVLQLPLYTIWRTGTPREIAFAIAHCTVGDVMIAALTLSAAILIVGRRSWPTDNYAAVAVCAIAFGICYTAFSEWLNLSRNNWAYSEFMPVIPGLGVGLSPLLQWLIVPAIAAWCAVPKTRHE